MEAPSRGRWQLLSTALLPGLLVSAKESVRSTAGVGVQSDVAASSYQELHYQQSLDHFNPEAHNRWEHRYLLNDENWDGRGKLESGCKGPILMYAGNEGAIEFFWQSNGFMINELAPRWGALLLFPEQRFYGTSLPFGNLSLTTENLKYLTTSQVLEDYIELLSHLKATLPGAAGCPVVAFGGSYGGTLAALLRAAYPAAITGALAASSELGYYDVAKWEAHGVTAFAFEDRVARDFEEARPDCMHLIDAAKKAIVAVEDSELVRIFDVCEAEVLGPQRSDLFVYALEGLAQQDYPYAVGSVPASPINATCDLLAEAKYPAALVTAAARVTQWSLGYDNTSTDCLPDQGAGVFTGPGDGPGKDSWGWQSCTETLHRFSAQKLRTYAFNFSRMVALCSSLYSPSVTPDTDALARRFGGFALADGTAGVSRIIWSHGMLDPWGGWFQNIAEPPSGSEVYHFVMEGAAHHLDLRGSRPDADPPMVTAARRREAEIIEGWIYGPHGRTSRDNSAFEGEQGSTIFA